PIKGEGGERVNPPPLTPPTGGGDLVGVIRLRWTSQWCLNLYLKLSLPLKPLTTPNFPLN
ncbi:MAG: hypothetical protein Q6354_09705, partial [Candidatus Brocadiales bacterium]|nr:hypothetical protein [Candidatus Brocadiales bacterium]